jgi:hypothetical protein
MASAQLVRRFAALGGQATLRAGVLTDNGNPILDVRGLHISDPVGHGMRDQPMAWRRQCGHLCAPSRAGLLARHD